MNTKLFPAKTLYELDEKGRKVRGSDGKPLPGTVHRLPEALEFYTPSMESVVAHLTKDGSLTLDESDDAKKYTEETGVPAYADEFTSWIMDVVYSAARTKASSGFKVLGDKPEELKVEITGNIPQSLEDLLASNRDKGRYKASKDAFVAAFAVWLENNVDRPARIIRALKKASIHKVDRRAWPLIESTIEKFCATLESESEYSSYLRSLRNQFRAGEEESSEWDDLPAV